jgi:hypothetical protein
MRLEDVHAIKHARELVMALHAMGDAPAILAPEQQAKMAQIENLLDALGCPSIDEELDATISALGEIMT